jgi:hypothetical protein
MMAMGHGPQNVISEEGWPCQRLRMAFSLILFFFFERLIGKQLPEVMPFIALGLGIACLASAMTAIQRWRLHAQLAVVKASIDQRQEIERRSRR